MIALIPHIIRRQEIYPENLRGIYVGNAAAVKLNLGPKPQESAAAGITPAIAAALPGTVATAPPATAPPATAPPATAPPATAPPDTAPQLFAPPATAPALVPQPPAPAPGSPARLVFSPSQVEANQGSSIVVTLSVEGGVDISSAPMQIQYDPKILRLNDVVRGGFLGSDGQQPVFTKNILNDMGIATVQLNRPPDTPGVSGAGPLLTLNFQAIAKGTTMVAIPNLTMRNSQGAVITSVNPQLGVTIK
jgi:hypothetical protein